MSSTVYTSALEIVFPCCYRSKTPSEVFPETLLFRLQNQPKLCSCCRGIYHQQVPPGKALFQALCYIPGLPLLLSLLQQRKT